MCIIDFDVCVECFALLVMMFFFGFVVGVGSVSIIDENVCVFPTSAEQMYGHDKMRQFSSGEHDMFTLGLKFEVNFDGIS